MTQKTSLFAIVAIFAFSIGMIGTQDAFAETTTYEIDLKVGKSDREISGIISNDGSKWTGNFSINKNEFTVTSVDFMIDSNGIPFTIGIYGSNNNKGLDRFINLDIEETTTGYTILKKGSNAVWVLMAEHGEKGKKTQPKMTIPVYGDKLTLLTE